MDHVKPPAPMPGARLLFSLDPAVAYLNHGSVGPVPISVQRTQQRLHGEMEENPMRFNRGLADRVSHVRRHLATFLGADPDGAALLANTTTGIALVLNSIDLHPGDEILLTDHGYGAARMAADALCQRTGAIIRTAAVPLGGSDEEIVRAVRIGVRPGRTRLAIVDQTASATAQHFPVRAIAVELHTVDVPVLVDAAHVPGMLPVQVDTIGADFWVGNFHKWGFAPRSTALLSVAPQWRDRIRPVIVSWEQERGYPYSVEFQGTLDRTAWLATPAGLYALRTLGADEVRAHNAALAAYGQRVVGAALGHRPTDLPDPGHPDASMRVVPLPTGVATTMDTAEQLRALIADRLATEVHVNAWRGLGLLRLSAQVYNRAEEYDRLADRLPALLAT